jgi:hypothetical protein
LDGRPFRFGRQVPETTRVRRERQRALAKIADHAPKRRNDLLPQLELFYVRIDELRPAHRRVRRPDPAQAARIRASIEEGEPLCQPKSMPAKAPSLRPTASSSL